jgi:phage repressor protein C with HTH and peptisase S24 domain
LEDTFWVALPDTYRIGEGLFVAQVKGESMNRLIPDGAWCLFRANPTGSREGRVVVVQHREISDVDTGAHATVKRYHSEKSASDVDDQWTHTRITLHPHSTQPRYKPIELTKEQAEYLKVVAEFVAVIG